MDRYCPTCSQWRSESIFRVIGEKRLARDCKECEDFRAKRACLARSRPDPTDFSGVDIDAIHYKLGLVKKVTTAGDDGMSGEGTATVDISRLDTEEGICAAAVCMGNLTLEAVFYPVLDRTPQHKRADLFERYLSALTGAMCAQVGAEVACRILDEVKIAIAAVQAGRERKH